MWVYKGKEFEKQPLKEIIGMTYLITEISSAKKYIGIKKFWEIEKTKPNKYLKKDGIFVKDRYGKRKLNKRTTKKHKKVESDWRTYNSSNKELANKIKNNPNNYTKEVIYLCNSIIEMKGREAQIQLDYYFTGRWNELYNEMINLRMRIRKT